MSVKAENRPESQLKIYEKVDNLFVYTVSLLKGILENTTDKVFAAEIEHNIIGIIVDLRASVSTFNKIDVYGDETYQERVKYQFEAYQSLNKLDSVLQLVVAYTGFKKGYQYKEFVNDINAIRSMLSKLYKSDKDRHRKGRDVCIAEYKAKKNENFVDKNKVYDNSEIPNPNAKDPMGLLKLIKPKQKQSKEEDVFDF